MSYNRVHRHSSHCTRGHCYKLQANHSRVDVRKFFFAERVVPIWNSLPATAEDFASLQTFRNFLANANLTNFLVYLFIYLLTSVTVFIVITLIVSVTC
jgi:uncharacterized membrane protein (DUF106 family)